MTSEPGRLPSSRPDFVAATHLVVRGSQADIGYALARAAIDVYGSAPRPMTPVLGRARHRWFAANWPEHHQRSRGMAAAFGVAADDPALGVDDLNGMPLAGGCSAAWCPPSPGAPAAIVRNFDIHASVVVTATPAGPRLPALARPHVIEMHPDEGLSSVAITGNNLAGCLEGINEAGLAVVELADGQGGTVRPTGSPQAGLGEAQLPRFLLDRCRTAAQAREALHGAKHYTRYSTCHYLIADAHGDAFVWEREGDNVEHIVDAGAAPLAVTNHLLAASTPDAAGSSHDRLRRLAGESDPGRLHAALDEIRAEETVDDGSAVTLWRSEYRMARPSLTVRFLLGLESGQRYSAPLSIAL